MESEERPSKMRKLDHASETQDASTSETTPVNGTAAPETATTEKPQDNKTQEPHAEASSAAQDAEGEPEAEAAEGEKPKLSKSQMKKLARHERWEAGREDRKIKRKQKIKERKERKREAYREALANPSTTSTPNNGSPSDPHFRSKKTSKAKQVPITVIFDCDFEELMFDNEMKSLGLQITRCYSDMRKAAYQPHLAVSSFGGKMKERFDGILAKQYLSWKGVRFCEEDFVEVAQKAKDWMQGENGGVVEGAIAPHAKTTAPEASTTEVQEADKEAEVGEAKDEQEEGEVVYLSSESENVLETLKPNSVYIIGGLVDKNRHKGICHKRAVERGIKTAKLPIGEFLHMKSRQVLVTNHVLEIMLKWMEFGDWGKAFMAVLPERKGAMLKSEYEESVQKEHEEDETRAEQA